MGTEFSPDYATKTDEELLHIALDAESLTPDARSALSSELKKRQLDSPDELTKFVAERRYHQHLDDINLGNLVLVVPHGVGRRAYGRTNIETIGTREEYDTTVFGVVFYFPLIPLATYRFSREQGSKQFVVREKKPTNWSQVLSVWLKAGSIVALIMLVFHFWLR
ncbi:MAG TPA: hypothetical protein VN911_11180 [Candidatus Acidoferrum sp.]|nr:hypothetical protein [Candidatus Acidoferrum sp.]